MKTILLVALFVLTMIVSFALLAEAQPVECATATQAPTVKLFGNAGHICPSATGQVVFSAEWLTGESEELTVQSQKHVAIPVVFLGACGDGVVRMKQIDEYSDASEVAVVAVKFRPCVPVLVSGAL